MGTCEYPHRQDIRTLHCMDEAVLATAQGRHYCLRHFLQVMVNRKWLYNFYWEKFPDGQNSMFHDLANKGR